MVFQMKINMKSNKIILSILATTALFNWAFAQQVPQKATLQQLIDYALQNKISIKQAEIDEAIGEKDIDISLSGWYPQLALTGNYNHNLKIPTNAFGGQTVVMGQKNSSNLTLQADQQLLNPALMQASKAAELTRLSNKQNTENVRINTVVDVSKAYYDILTSEEQINIVRENIIRLDKQLKDAQVRYEVGLVDKTDFKRAQIALSNARADEKRTVELRKYKYDYLKQLLALDIKDPLTLSFDNANMETEILLDTTGGLDNSKRIEFQQLETAKKLQQLNTQYYKWTYLPSLSAFINYGLDYRNDKFGDLYNDSFPRSTVGLNLTFPIFQGFKRKNQINKSQLQEARIDWDIQNLNNQISTEYSLAQASYNANLSDWKTSKDNVDLSKEVYNTIKLQYDEGIKTYLDLMTAETDLKTSQLNYLNALYALLSSKLDVQKALGNIQTN
ncbi:outer membrane efflux protein [Sphingobacterium spiritivorum ATCC 33300]|uniref:Outer membrane efflux protein n=2 Tax=Sphingobacteriaceae TaxID=84566 RepID=C2G4E3_SPHSI|nr:outer membrane efflux protein [Sphingobacterium spiritivorum ATCC 33300]QQS94902.1 TolC family protein [Sphingobacterium spiritivorum]QQT24920.1 TolC family protein [Sphingobacterium spiritivorum]